MRAGMRATIPATIPAAMRNVAYVTATAAALLLIAAGDAQAQASESELSVTAAFAHARPPANTDAPSAQYGLFAARGRAGSPTSSALEGAIDFGGSSTEGAARWISGDFAATPRVSCVIARCGVRIEGFGVHYPGDAPYTAGAGRLQPEVVFGDAARGLVRLSASWTRGSWQADIPGTTPSPGGLLGGGGIPQPAQHHSGDLAVQGGAISAGLPVGLTWLQASAEAWHSTGGAVPGDYRGAGLQTAFVTGMLAFSIGGALWDTPAGVKSAYRAATSLSLGGGVALRVEAGQSVADPLYGTPGSFTSTIGISWTTGGASRTAIRAAPKSSPATIVRNSGASHLVKFSLRRPTAQSVAVAGDFNEWKTVSMQRSGDTFSVEIALPAGVHHYAFLVDGKDWTVPDNAPGIVDDGWGKKNATIVVEGR
jgi:hypothetical protein